MFHSRFIGRCSRIPRGWTTYICMTEEYPPWPPMPSIFEPSIDLYRLGPLPPSPPLKSTHRKQIPKKIRGQVWSSQFGISTKGVCYCCKKPLDVFDIWHAGHIISRAKGGVDTADNLRPLCPSCNLSMGTENMDDFKRRFYP